MEDFIMKEKYRKILPYSFYKRSTIKVAKELLGKLLVHNTREGMISGIIVETEAYLGRNDPASHAAAKKTPRNSVMFGHCGRAYVYFIYGNHYCFNVVAHPDNVAGAVLIRALEPCGGIQLMRENRDTEQINNLTNGPGKLTQALGIARSHNGCDLKKDSLKIYDIGCNIKAEVIARCSRIGIKEGLDLLLRFYIKDNRNISRK